MVAGPTDISIWRKPLTFLTGANMEWLREICAA